MPLRAMNNNASGRKNPGDNKRKRRASTAMIDSVISAGYDEVKKKAQSLNKNTSSQKVSRRRTGESSSDGVKVVQAQDRTMPHSTPGTQIDVPRTNDATREVEMNGPPGNISRAVQNGARKDLSSQPECDTRNSTSTAERTDLVANDSRNSRSSGSPLYTETMNLELAPLLVDSLPSVSPNPDAVNTPNQHRMRTVTSNPFRNINNFRVSTGGDPIVQEINNENSASQVDNNLIQELENKMYRIVNDALVMNLKAVTQRLGDIESMVSDLKADVRNINSVTDGHNMKMPKDAMRSAIVQKLSKFPMLYDRALLLVVTEKCVIGRTSKLIFDESQGSFTDRIAFAVRSLLFARKPQDLKAEFQSKTGKQYCVLRRSMSRTALTQVEQDKFGRFLKDGETNSGNNGRKKGCKMVRPNWCALKFVRTEHLDAIQRRLEVRQGKGRPRNGSSATCENEHCALEVSKKIFNLMTSLLTRCRERSKKSIFEQIGFLFTHWTSYGITLDQAKTKFVWPSDEVPDDEEEDLHSIPYAKVSDVTSTLDTKRRVKRENSVSWTKLLKEKNDFLFFASYQVSVRNDKAPSEKTNCSSQDDTNVDALNGDDENGDDESETTSKQSDPTDTSEEEVQKYITLVSEGDVKLMYRAFNILDLSAQFLSTYCGSKVDDLGYDIFSVSPDSFRVVYSIAVLLRTCIRKLISDYDTLGPATFMEGKELENEREINGFRLTNMFPCAAKRHSILYRNCLGVSQEEYSEDCLDKKYEELFVTEEEQQSDVPDIESEVNNEQHEGIDENDDDNDDGALNGERSSFDDFAPTHDHDEEETEEDFS